jgi:molybdopterin/thiamine biosynthesis adenylyltransferase
MKPQIYAYNQLEKLKKEHPELRTEDTIDLALAELFDIAYPSKKDSKTDDEVESFADELTNSKPLEWGDWVYYPWLNLVIHFPPKNELRALRTSRNRNLITDEEQAKLYKASLLIVGMSVGSNIVEALVSQGIGSKLILVDMDIIEPSNLNRIRSPYHHVGLHKVEAVSRKVWEIDPYIEVIDYRDGLNDENLIEIIETHKPDVMVDEIDELRMKIVIREAAKKYKLPVVMAADDGDDALIDIERYDLDPELALFSGRIPETVLDEIKQGGIPRPRLGMMIGKYFVGAENIPLRMYQSLGEVGKTLPSWPQLGGAAALSGISLAYAIKRIMLGQSLTNGRVLVSLDEKLSQDHLDKEHQEQLAMFRNMLEGSK